MAAITMFCVDGHNLLVGANELGRHRPYKSVHKLEERCRSQLSGTEALGDLDDGGAVGTFDPESDSIARPGYIGVGW
jgi:hypothetical protein